LCFLIIYGCGSEPSDLLFSRLDNTGISFSNTLTYDEQVNTYTFKNFYNGGGVGIGDFNNDGLPEVFFCGSQVESKLYRNDGNFKFQDITQSSNIRTKGVWVTGVSIADVNGDGLLDIYLCKSGPPNGANRRNSLYINLGDFKFEDQAEQYGLDNLGLSSHAAFFDYDHDGDLDCYLLNNSIRSVGAYDYKKGLREEVDTLGGNKFFRNDDGLFVDVTTSAGIYSSAIGFGLGVTITDFNNDGWADIYVSNDFFERDYLYINQSDGTFSEELTERISELSMGSMGADIADINNDGFEEIFVTEMLPERHDRLKSKAQFEKWDKYQLSLNNGYHRQFGRNAFQMNNGNGTYSEISRLSDMDATDWSWGALIFDMDNDGFKDVFIANGINKDLLDQDYINFSTDPSLIRSMIKQEKDAIKELINMIPSEPLPNFAFKNLSGGKFESNADNWGLGEPSFSNGSGYGDLDGDGDLDLVINNVNQEAFIYQNNSDKLDNSFVTIELKGEASNLFAIGSKVTIFANGQRFSQELFPARGFQSSVDYKLVFGLGKSKKIDSVVVRWPSGRISTHSDQSVNTTLTLDSKNAVLQENVDIEEETYFVEVSNVMKFPHKENEFVDFDKERLLFEMNSAKGPCTCVGDINMDGREDIFIGGSWGTASYLALQQVDGSFKEVTSPVDVSSENVSCQFVDFNRDGFLDLIIGNGGSEANSFSLQLKDKLYQGNGKGGFTLEDVSFFNNKLGVTGIVQASGWDDSSQYIFVGESQIPGLYGVNASSYLLKNNGTSISLQQELKDFGLVASAAWGDIDNDDDQDLVVVGNWMSPLVLINEDGKFVIDSLTFRNKNGFYNVVRLFDIDSDQDLDMFFGNEGLNNRYHASTERPMKMYIGDLDGNGRTEQVIGQYFGDEIYPLLQLKDLLMQVPSLKKSYLRFNDYKNASFGDIVARSKTPPMIKTVQELKSEYYLNTDSGFVTQALPLEAQYSSVNAIEFLDANEDGNMDMIIGGNDYKIKPEWGINAASYAQLLLGNGKGGFDFASQNKSGLKINGQIRHIKSLLIDEEEHIVFIRNDDFPVLIKKR